MNSHMQHSPYMLFVFRHRFVHSVFGIFEKNLFPWGGIYFPRGRIGYWGRAALKSIDFFDFVIRTISPHFSRFLYQKPCRFSRFLVKERSKNFTIFVFEEWK